MSGLTCTHGAQWQNRSGEALSLCEMSRFLARRRAKSRSAGQAVEPGFAMHHRCLPLFPDFGSFLSHLDRNGELQKVEAPISTRLEITELHRRVIAAKGPVLRFSTSLDERDVASGFPVVTNLFGTRERVAAGLGTDVPGLATLGALLAWMKSPQPPQTLREARLMLPAARSALLARPRIVAAPRIWRELDPDFSLLPVQTCWPGDAGPLITWPVVVTRPPGEDDPAAYNLGVYRM